MASIADLFAADSPPRQRARTRSASPASLASTPAPRRLNNTLFLSSGGSQATPRRRNYDEMNDYERDATPEGYSDLDEDRNMLPDWHPDMPRGASTPPPAMRVEDLERIGSMMNNNSNNGGDGANGNEYDTSRMFIDPFAVQDPLAGLAAEEEEPVKKKRHVAKVDAERLLGPHGFPALIKIASKWKPKGKGHETRDLHRILDVYQMWAHTMFPKGQFMYTVGRVDKVARQRNVQSALDGMREAFKNPQAILSAEYELDPDIEAEASAMADMASQQEHGITVVGSNGPTAGPEPLFDQPDDDFGFEDELAAMEAMERDSARPRHVGGEEDEDMDELAAMEEMEREASRRAAADAAAARLAAVTSASASASGSASPAADVTAGTDAAPPKETAADNADFDVDEIAAVEEMEKEATRTPTATRESVGAEEPASGDNSASAITNNTPDGTTTTAKDAPTTNDKEELDDIDAPFEDLDEIAAMEEMEEEARRKYAPVTSTTVETGVLGEIDVNGSTSPTVSVTVDKAVSAPAPAVVDDDEGLYD